MQHPCSLHGRKWDSRFAFNAGNFTQHALFPRGTVLLCIGHLNGYMLLATRKGEIFGCADLSIIIPTQGASNAAQQS